MNSKENFESIILSYSKQGYSLIMDNILLILIILLMYVLVSTFILRKFIRTKSMKAIGGNVEVKTDPLLIILPVLLIIILSAFWIVIFMSKSK
jgi:heme/copper-type cytochrome/quinol oxidase subunit 2